MKSTVRENIFAPYSLHDMNVMAFEVSDSTLVMRTQSGIVKATPPYCQTEGYVQFHGVQWDFCHVYLMEGAGHTGPFTGEKLLLRDFLRQHPLFGFSIMDETYGYNMTRYSGYLMMERKHFECMVDIYHEGDMIFVAEQ